MASLGDYTTRPNPIVFPRTSHLVYCITWHLPQFVAKLHISCFDISQEKNEEKQIRSTQDRQLTQAGKSSRVFMVARFRARL